MDVKMTIKIKVYYFKTLLKAEAPSKSPYTANAVLQQGVKKKGIVSKAIITPIRNFQ